MLYVTWTTLIIGEGSKLKHFAILSKCTCARSRKTAWFLAKKRGIAPKYTTVYFMATRGGVMQLRRALREHLASSAVIKPCFISPITLEVLCANFQKQNSSTWWRSPACFISKTLRFSTLTQVRRVSWTLNNLRMSYSGDEQRKARLWDYAR